MFLKYCIYAFSLFHLNVSTDHPKHATAKIQFSHETLIIYDYWKTLAFCNYLVNIGSKNEYILKCFFQIFLLIYLRTYTKLLKHPVVEIGVSHKLSAKYSDWKATNLSN